MADFLLPLLIGGGGGILAWLLNQNPDFAPTTKNVNTDYTNNPIWQQLFGSGGQYGAAQGGMESYMQNAITAGENYDPSAFWKDFMAAQPEMQDLISGPLNSFKSASEANLADFVKQAVSGTASELSGMGSLYSGALGSISGAKIGGEAAKAGTDMARLQAELLSQLYGSTIPQFASGRQFKTSSLVNTYLGGADMYSKQLAQMLGIGADLSSPMYVQQPGLADSIMSGMGLGLQGGAAQAMMSGSGGGGSSPQFDWTKLFTPGAKLDFSF